MSSSYPGRALGSSWIVAHALRSPSFRNSSRSCPKSNSSISSSLTIARASDRNNRRWPSALGWSSHAAISSSAGSNASNASEEIKDGQSLVRRDGLEPRDRLRAAEGESALPTRGMMTITSGMPALRHSRGNGCRAFCRTHPSKAVEAFA